MPRYSIGAEFFLDAPNADDAATIVGNFVDSFPDQVRDEAKDPNMDPDDAEDPDLILQGPAEEQ